MTGGEVGLPRFGVYAPALGETWGGGGGFQLAATEG